MDERLAQSGQDNEEINDKNTRPRKCIMSSIVNIVTCRIGTKLEFVWFFIGLLDIISPCTIIAVLISIQSLTQSIDCMNE